MERKGKMQAFLGYLIFSFLIGGIFFKTVYSPDSYNIMFIGLENYNMYALGNMRPLQYLICNVFMKILGSDVKYELIYNIYLIISIVLISISMYLVYINIIRILNENKKITSITKLKKVLIYFSVVFMFFNMYLSDNLFYLENMTMMLALFLAVLASVLYSKDIRFKNMICLVLLILSEFSYQTMITAFVLLSLVFHAFKNNEKIDIKYLFKISILFMIPLLLLFIFSMIVQVSGITVNTRYAESLNQFLSVFLGVIIQVPVYILLNYLIYMLLSTICSFIHIDKEKKYIEYNLFFIIVSGVVYTYLFGFINAGFISNRMAWSIGALASIICLFIIIYREDFEINKKRYMSIVAIMFIFEISIYYVYYGIFYRYNRAIDYNVNYVRSYISEWNNTHDEKIKKVAIYEDKELTPSKWYSLVPCLTLRIYNISDSFGAHLNVFSDEKLEIIKSDEEILNKYFKDKDWNDYNLEEFVVIGDTLHFCRF